MTDKKMTLQEILGRLTEVKLKLKKMSNKKSEQFNNLLHEDTVNELIIVASDINKHNLDTKFFEQLCNQIKYKESVNDNNK
jgi:hypothetical protein